MEVNESKWFLQLRIKKGLSQTDLGSIIGVSQPTIAEIEKGGRRLRLKEFLTLANELNLTYTDLPLSLQSCFQSKEL